MKITKRTEIHIKFTAEEVFDALLDALPKRFTGKHFTVDWLSDGGAIVSMTPEVK